MAQMTRTDDKTYLQQYGDQLNDTTRRAKWIGSTGEHEDHPGQTLATRDHDVIQQWAEERGAVPAGIEGSEHAGRPGVLRLDFPGYEQQQSGRLRSVDWNKWFESFDQRDLVFLYQEHLKNGNQSNFFKFDSPHREQG